MKSVTKNTLIAYLYGELDEAEAAQVKQYLEENAAARQEWERLSSTRVKLQQVEDESIEEPIFWKQQKIQTNTPEGKWKKWAVAAAIFVGILYSVAWMNIRISLHNNELSIRLGKDSETSIKEVVPAANTLASITTSDTAKLSQIHTITNDSVALKRIVLLEQKLQRQIYALQMQQSVLQKHQTGLTSEQVAGLMNDLQQENFETMQQLLSSAGQQQQLYSQQLLTQLTDYLASQRKDDLQKINAVLNNIVQNTDQKQQQTDFLLTQVISKLNEGEKDKEAN
ncbi:hypothetical protein QNI19_34035 [Cytophagaceae bacterium DM2B3-1]|uniref:Anti-sigma factor n=1 Tax=Xanthocytophaga flava TaxID=3048013 RepID=A0ABT7CWA0_9BACT|nr:hypothetical protein [Xanthocytophaga flavus]MDJ1467450.1 hypothetical protein [Xanthocytophaga flavus]MDJ1498012.1 hypothetical protein [Xanthocytophaga flavus]